MDSTLLDLFGAKYERRGSTPNTYDCKSLFVEVMNRYGHPIKTPDIEVLAIEQVLAAEARGEYAYTEIDANMIQSEIASGRWEKIDQPEEGCAVVIALDPAKPNLVQHLGVYIGDNKFIHILKNTGVITTRLDDRFFQRKIRGYYKWKNS